MAQDTTIIFPMAGPGVRFGYSFKPFLRIGDSTFIERAVSSFDRYRENIKEIIFVFLEEQEQQYHVSEQLRAMFPGLRYSAVILNAPTKGPAETVRKALEKHPIEGGVIICDCDHYLDVSPLFLAIKEHPVDCTIPLWNLRGENIKSWSVAALSDDGLIRAIAEKELPKAPGGFFGVIGCYYFRSAAPLMENDQVYISEIIRDLMGSGSQVAGAKILHAEFFGDPQRLQSALDARSKKKGTILCDLDGAIVKHEDVPSYGAPLEVLPGSVEKLRHWRNEGYMLVLTSARKSEDEKDLIAALQAADIPYDRLLMDFSPGPRYLINDRKPSDILTPHAVAFEIERNSGIQSIEIDSVKPNVLKMFKGGSLSRTLLIERAEQLLVRKVVSKDKSVSTKYLKLRKQFSDMQRLANLCREIVPEMYGENENYFEYFYDMEFLTDHDLLANHSAADKLKAVKWVLKKMSTYIYQQRAYIPNVSAVEWLANHFSDKIYPKLQSERLTSKLASFAQSERVLIDGQPYEGVLWLLKKFLQRPLVERVIPTYLCSTHGDLTFENILFKGNSYDRLTNSYEPSVKLVDTDCIDVLDPPELDLGKIFQSVVSQYELWSAQQDPLIVESGGAISTLFTPNMELRKDLPEYIQAWSGIIPGDVREIEMKGYFYMGLHLIRMIPFRLAVSEDQALFALVSAMSALNKALHLMPASPTAVSPTDRLTISQPSDAAPLSINPH